MHFKLVAGVAVVAALLGTLAGCPGSLKDPAEFESDSSSGTSPTESGGGACEDVPTVFFPQTCGQALCHSAKAPQEMLDLVSPGVATRLVNVAATEMPGSGLLLINSANPPESVIVTKLQASTLPYGALMPFGGAALSSDQVACVAAWVDSVIADAGPNSSTDGGEEATATEDASAGDSTAPEAGTVMDAGADAASESGGNVTLTVLNYKSWCSVTINGGAASTNAMLTASVTSGSTATIVAMPASSKFVIGTDPWFGVTQNNGGAAPGTDHGTGTTETSTATVVATGANCVSVCCGDAPKGTNCPTATPCQ